MEEKSALDMIDEMYRMMQSMQRTIQMMDRNVKLLNDKANGTLFADAISALKSSKLTPTQKAIAADLDAPSQVGVIQQSITDEQPIPYTQKVNAKVNGKLTTEDGKPIHGVNIIIMNSANKVVKNTRTNRAGMWMTHLPPGKYSIRYEQDGRVTQYKAFDIKDGQTEVNIA
jgi:hypothetical protein